MDGGASITTAADTMSCQRSPWREVDEDHFAGALALPLFGRPRPGFEFEFAGSRDLPAGRRTDWTNPGTFCGPTKAIRIITPTGKRLFIAADMPYRTHAEAMQQLEDGIDKAARQVVTDEREKNEAEAARLGITVEELIAKRSREALMERYRRAARDHEDERRALEGGSWIRNGKLSPEARAHYYGTAEDKGV